MDAPGKKKTLIHYLSRGVAMIHLDARRPGVTVPAKFRDDPHLRLNLSYRYSIPDLDVSEERVQATLSFGGVPFQCLVPWEAVFGITSHASGDGQVWPEDLPTEVVRSLAERDDEPRPAGASASTSEAPPKPRPGLVALEGKRPAAVASSTQAPDQEKPSPPEGGTPRRGHLRLVR